MRATKREPALEVLLRADAQMAMPRAPSWYRGRDSIVVCLRHLFANPFGRDPRLLPTTANHRPTLAIYAPPEAGTIHAPFAVNELTTTAPVE